MMKTVEATFRIVTPMFIGGADQTPDDGVRPPSVKGALRFWWRALNWGRFYESNNRSNTEALKALHREEGRLFGLAAKSEKGKQVGGQGCFLIEVTSQPSLDDYVTDWPQSHTKKGVNSKSGYLGLGLFQMNKHFQRHAIKESEEFSVRLLFRNNTEEKDIESMRIALKAIGLFGGIGSRSRRGFGSVALVKLDKEEIKRNLPLPEYEQIIQDFKADIEVSSDVLPPFTAFSEHLKIAHGNPGNNARQVHSEAGERYLKHRSNPSGPRGSAKRWFGFPLEGVSKPEERRSSPLFFHIHPVGDKFVCLNLLLPSIFLPGEATKPDDFANVTSYIDGLQEIP